MPRSCRAGLRGAGRHCAPKTTKAFWTSQALIGTITFRQREHSRTPCNAQEVRGVHPTLATSAGGTVDASNAYNLVAICASLLAVLLSSFFAWMALRQNNNSLHLPVILEYLGRHRSPEFVRKERNLWTELAIIDHGQGFEGVPPDLRDDLYEVAYYYQALAYMTEWGVVSRRITVHQVHYRLLQTWDAILPFVEAERRQRGGPLTFLNSMEIFVLKAREVDISKVTLEMALLDVGVHRRGGVKRHYQAKGWF